MNRPRSRTAALFVILGVLAWLAVPVDVVLVPFPGALLDIFWGMLFFGLALAMRLRAQPPQVPVTRRPGPTPVGAGMER